MRLKFIDGDTPINYSTFSSSTDSKLSQSKTINGKTYVLLGSFEKTHTLIRRIGIGIRAVCKILFSLGFGLYSESVREDWKSFWNGKKSKVIYSSSPTLSIKLLADRGNATAQHKLGLMYEQGQGVPQSDQEAIKYYQLAADQGNPDAQFSLGFMYKKGRGVPQSDQEAIKYYQLAADQGNADARYNLGRMYKKGRGVPPSYKKAFECFKLVADQGDPFAQYYVGVMYKKGRGVAQSDQEADKYFKLAADQGIVK
ncbi:tetratricopeptide repeat protein [Candidatus Protochlamydia sp. W-9]|uniref:tetratricopeptide repeat protein n=1 Tax=Candidatus Protochlamydia sp. W-9 TaxID=1785087 RepID=UPI00096AA23B|nr:tetratricopeptide repeat protein [Candidatus Protochlamydia sp. W-9]